MLEDKKPKMKEGIEIERENIEILEKLKEVSKLIQTITEKDLRDDINWLSQVRHSKGFLEQGIKELSKKLLLKN